MSTDGEESQASPPRAGRPSLVLSAVIIFGLMLVVAGVAFALLGLGNVGVIGGEAKGVELRTTSLGVVMIVVGALLSGLVATNLPNGYQIYGGRRESVAQKALRVLASRGMRPYLSACI